MSNMNLYVFIYNEYEKLLEDLHPGISKHDLAVEVDKHFATYFENFVLKPRAWTEVGDSDHQKDVAFQEDEVIASEIISYTTEAFEHDDISSNSSDYEIDNDVEREFDDANNSGDDGIADSEGSFEYSTSEN
ncbi:hypothetical protein L1887_39026 [Cichorium endivia]|nr:hypothetical protein L1887_39026 [Cichorium endivia]